MAVPPNPLQALFLAEGKEEAMPVSLNFTNAVVVRNPYLWVLLFEARGVDRATFVTEDGTAGPLTLRYIEAVKKVFSGSDSPPYTLYGTMKENSERLSEIFQSLGVLYSQVPMGGANAQIVAQNMLTVLMPQLRLA